MNAEMIELQRDENPDDPEGQDVELWHDVEYRHVIVREDWEHSLHAPGWYVRDEHIELGAFGTFGEALAVAQAAWGTEVTLAPANRLRAAVEVEDENDVGTYLLEYLATYGTVGIDAQALAVRVFERIEEE
jgi:hypothetical protein